MPDEKPEEKKEPEAKEEDKKGPAWTSAGERRVCQKCEEEFRIEADDFEFYEKMSLPAPTFCPECRLQRRLSFRNERNLYKRKCGLCEKDMISVYAPDKPYTVYCQPCWWSDKWDALSYGADFEPSRPFFEQFQELYAQVPLPALNTLYQTLENSEYTNQVGYLKNCYLLTNSDYSEHCAYGSEVEHSKDCVDNLMIESCELSYGCVNCASCYRAFYSDDCESSQDIWFSKNLSGCSHCFGCINLKGKKYHIFNQPYSKADYEAKLKELAPERFENLAGHLEKTRELFLSFPHKFRHGKQNSAVSGDYLNHTNRVYNSFIVRDSQDCKYCLWLIVGTNKDCWDHSEYGDNAQRTYEAMNVGNNVSDVKFSYYCFNNCVRAEYSVHSYGASDLFGCVGLNKKQYCILNKQYTKEEYEKLKMDIVAQMAKVPYIDMGGRTYGYGEFFPSDLSPFGYNETSAIEHFPRTEAQAALEGFAWKAEEERDHKATLEPEALPSTAAEAGDDILEATIGCVHKGECAHNCPSVFRLTPQELQFYKQLNLSLPRLCSNCRHYERLTRRNPLKLWQSMCACKGTKVPIKKGGEYANTAAHFHGETPCPNDIATSYDPARPEIVYCEDCYNAETA